MSGTLPAGMEAAFAEFICADAALAKKRADLRSRQTLLVEREAELLKKIAAVKGATPEAQKRDVVAVADVADPTDPCHGIDLLQLSEDVLIHDILAALQPVSVLRFACCSIACSLLTRSDALWESLCRVDFPDMDAVFVSVQALPDGIRNERMIIPMHLAERPPPRALHHARFAASLDDKTKARRFLALCDGAIAICKVRPINVPALGRLLRQIDEEHATASIGSEARAWLWVIGALLLCTLELWNHLICFAREVDLQLDTWYSHLAAGTTNSEIHLPVLVEAYRNRSCLEEILTTLNNLAYDQRHHVPKELCMRLDSHVDLWDLNSRAYVLTLNELRQGAMRINANILSMRAEGCDLSVPNHVRPRSMSKASGWWWWIEAPMHVSGGNPYVLPLPDWMDSDLCGRTTSLVH